MCTRITRKQIFVSNWRYVTGTLHLWWLRRKSRSSNNWKAGGLICGFFVCMSKYHVEKKCLYDWVWIDEAWCVKGVECSSRAAKQYIRTSPFTSFTFAQCFHLGRKIPWLQNTNAWINQQVASMNNEVSCVLSMWEIQPVSRTEVVCTAIPCCGGCFYSESCLYVHLQQSSSAGHSVYCYTVLYWLGSTVLSLTILSKWEIKANCLTILRWNSHQ